MVFSLTKTIHPTYIRSKFTMHTMQKNTTLYRNRNGKKVDRNLTFQERALNVPSLLLEQYNGNK